MKKTAHIPPPSPATPGPQARAGAVIAVVAAAAFVAALALRPVSSFDVGYHLAYGEQFLQTGRIVDANDYIYTCEPSLAPDRRPAPGPGCWYDDQGRYRFPNANWLSQVLMAAAYRAGGMEALSVLAAAIVVGILAAGFLAARRGGVSAPAAAAGVVLAALAGYERFNMRPELMGYLVLLVQLAILVPAAAGRDLSRRAALALVALQLLLVNLHSYFPLGLALTGALLADRLARWAWQRFAARADAAQPARQARRSAIVLAAQAAVCLANPWTWRLALLPVQTLVYFAQYDITGAAGGKHPWANIVELYPTFAPGAFATPIATGAFVVVLTLAGAGALAAAVKRRWAWGFILVGAAAVGFSTRRNIAVASAIVVPLALASLWPLLAPRLARAKQAAILALAGPIALTLLAAALALAVVSQRFYDWEGSTYRFGVGADSISTPLAAAEWINANQPAGRLWTDVDSSSNMYFFTRPHRAVPSLTNTWAYPPSIFMDSLELVAGRRKAVSPGKNPFAAVADGFEPVVKAYGVETVLIHAASLLTGSDAPSLGNSLVRDPRWNVVCLDAQFILFLRADGANAPLARRLALEPSPVLPANAPPAPWLAEYAARLRRLDPLPAHSLRLAGRTCQYLGFLNEAVELFTQSLQLDPAQPMAWNQLGKAHADRANLRLRGAPGLAGDTLAAAKDFAAARSAFQKAADLGSAQAAENLRRLP